MHTSVLLILDRSNESQRKDFEKEINCLREVGDHGNIVRYFGVAENFPGMGLAFIKSLNTYESVS